jgi:predicted NBD/HSP70 family sugar kinase
MTLVPDGPQCNCGNRGCWETLIGPRAIIDRVRQAATLGHTPLLMALPEVDGDVSTIRMNHVLQAAALNEPAVLNALDEVGRYLGIGVASLVNAFNPSLVVLGGVLSLAGPYVLLRTQQEVNARALTAARESVTICLSTFRSDACVMGGVSLIVRDILNSPADWQARSAEKELAGAAVIVRRGE